MANIDFDLADEDGLGEDSDWNAAEKKSRLPFLVYLNVFRARGY